MKRRGEGRKYFPLKTTRHSLLILNHTTKKNPVIYSKNWSPDLACVKSLVTLLGPNGEMDQVSPYLHNMLAEMFDNFTSSWNKVYVCLYPYQAPVGSPVGLGTEKCSGHLSTLKRRAKLFRSALYRPWSTFLTNMTGMRRQPPSVIMNISHKILGPKGTNFWPQEIRTKQLSQTPTWHFHNLGGEESQNGSGWEVPQCVIFPTSLLKQGHPWVHHTELHPDSSGISSVREIPRPLWATCFSVWSPTQ